MNSCSPSGCGQTLPRSSRGTTMLQAVKSGCARFFPIPSARAYLADLAEFADELSCCAVVVVLPEVNQGSLFRIRQTFVNFLAESGVSELVQYYGKQFARRPLGKFKSPEFGDDPQSSGIFILE